MAGSGADGVTITPIERSPVKFAFIGVRACELRAIGIQDRVLLEGPYVDASHALRRRDAFIVAVNCGGAGGTCFCVSMQAGPKATSGFDLALTELNQGTEADFLLEVGSDAGAELASPWMPCAA